MSSINLVVIQGSLTRPDLKREMKYLEKLLYKNRNQHRESQHFHRLQEVHNFLRLWDGLRVPELVASLSSEGFGPVLRPIFGQGNVAQPKQSTGVLLLQRIIAGCKLMEALSTAIRKAGAALSAQLALTFFVPLCLTGLAIVARMQVLAAQWVHDAVMAYNTLVEHVSALPQQSVPPGLDLPQMLKCVWEGRTRRVAQIPYPEGDSFHGRLQESSRLAELQKLQKLRPESRAALFQLFGNDFDIGEKVERESSAAAEPPRHRRNMAEAASMALRAPELGIAFIEDRAPLDMWIGKDSATHANQPYQSPSSFSLAFEPSTDAIAAQRAPVSDEDSVWSVHEDESPGNAAFGSVDYVTGPVLTGPAAAEEAEQDTMQIDSMSERLQDAARLSSQHESGDMITEAGRPQSCSNPEGHQDSLGMDPHPEVAVYGQSALALQHESQDRSTEAGRQVSSSVRVLQASVDRASHPEAASKSRPAETRQQPIFTQIAELLHGDISPHCGEDYAASDMRVHQRQATDAAQILSAQQMGAPLDGTQAVSSTPLYCCQLQGLGEVLPILPGQDLANSTGIDNAPPGKLDLDTLNINLPPGVAEDWGTASGTIPAHVEFPVVYNKAELESAIKDCLAAGPGLVPQATGAQPVYAIVSNADTRLPAYVSADIALRQPSVDLGDIPSKTGIQPAQTGVSAGQLRETPTAMLPEAGASDGGRVPPAGSVGILKEDGSGAQMMPVCMPAAGFADSDVQVPAAPVGSSSPPVVASPSEYGSSTLRAPSKAQLKRARQAAAKQRSALNMQQTPGQKRAWQDWLGSNLE